MKIPEQKPESFAALILAAGYSDRMGMPKAFLPFDHTRTFLEKIVSEFRAFGCAPVAVVLNEEGMERYEEMQMQHKDSVTAILNPAPEKERFFSLQTGLIALNPKSPVFLHNVDNPFLTQNVLQALATASQKNTGLAQASACAKTFYTPTYQNEGGHPVLLSQEIVKALTETSDYNQNLWFFLEDFAQVKVPVYDPDILANINSPEEYKRYFLNKK